MYNWFTFGNTIRQRLLVSLSVSAFSKRRLREEEVGEEEEAEGRRGGKEVFREGEVCFFLAIRGGEEEKEDVAKGRRGV